MSHNNEFFSAICRVSRALAGAMNRDEVLDLIVENAVSTLGVKASMLFLYEREDDEFIVVAQKGMSQNYVENGITQPRKLADALFKEGYLFSRDCTTDPRLEHHELKEGEGFASILTVPVLVRNEPIGGLVFYTSEPRDFAEKEIEFATALAEQGGIAIDHARLVDQLRENTRLFLDLGINIGSSLEMKKILHILSADVAEALKVKASSILLVDEDKGSLELVASYGLSEAYLDRRALSVEKSVSETFKDKAVAIRDALTDERVQYKEAKRKEGIASILSVPIKTKEKVIGALRLYSGAPREFTRDEIMLVTALAYQGGLAIQNAAMYMVLQKDMKDLQEDVWSHRMWF